MTTILVTRHFSGFANRADSFSIGDNEHEGNAACTRYTLPAGYSLADGAIYDASGFAARIYPGEAGEPVLVSLAGPAADTALVAA